MDFSDLLGKSMGKSSSFEPCLICSGYELREVVIGVLLRESDSVL